MNNGGMWNAFQEKYHSVCELQKGSVFTIQYLQTAIIH